LISAPERLVQKAPAAGYGPWPEGSMTFASFLSRL
jgi:hypothetical protein